jgi:hypothetical protein
MKSQASVPAAPTVHASHSALCTLPSPIQAIGTNRNQTEVIGTNSRINLEGRQNTSLAAIHSRYPRFTSADPRITYARSEVNGTRRHQIADTPASRLTAKLSETELRITLPQPRMTSPPSALTLSLSAPNLQPGEAK